MQSTVIHLKQIYFPAPQSSNLHTIYTNHLVMAENIKITNNKYVHRVWPIAGNQLIVANVTIIKCSLFFKEEKHTNLHEHLF